LKVQARFASRRYWFRCFVLVLVFHRASSVSPQDLSVVGTPQQTNQRIHTLGEASKSAPHDFTIGNGDLLSISVFDVPELSREVRVSQSGTISIPLVPARLHVAGLTEVQAEQKIADVLEAKGLVSHPEVGVMVKEHRSKPITIVGAVQHPMVYQADRTVTLLEVLAEAGGVANDAGDTIIVTHPRSAIFIQIENPAPGAEPAPGAATSPGAESPATAPNTPPFPSASEMTQSATPAATASTMKEETSAAGNVITINLNELVESGDMRNNITLQAGDVVTVPHAGIIYVLGAVNRPGGFVMSNDRTELTTLKVLSLAGGLTKIAKLDHAVIIRTDSQGKQTETEVDLKKVIQRQSEDLQMRASEILYVPESRSKEVMYQTIQIAVAVGTGVALYRLAYH
jgi:polysaccharide export outer membrane protein